MAGKSFWEPKAKVPKTARELKYEYSFLNVKIAKLQIKVMLKPSIIYFGDAAKKTFSALLNLRGASSNL